MHSDEKDESKKLNRHGRRAEVAQKRAAPRIAAANKIKDRLEDQKKARAERIAKHTHEVHARAVERKAKQKTQ